MFFTFPLAIPLLMIMIFSSLILPLILPSSGTPIVSVAILIIWMSFVIRLCFSIMEYLAQGHHEAMDFSKLLSFSNGWVFLKLVAIGLVLGFVTIKVMNFSFALGMILVIFFVLAYPAMNIVLCTDKSILSAINPLRLIFVMSVMGKGYWILFALTLVFSMTITFTQELAFENLPRHLSLSVAHLAYLYFNFALYAMIGYAIYQYHHELGFSVFRDTLHQNVAASRASVASGNSKNASKSSQEGDGAYLKEARIYIQEGRYQEAQDTLIDALKVNEQDNEIYEMLYRLFELRGNSDWLAKLTEKHLTILHQTKQRNLMRMVFLNTSRLIPDYQPKDPKVIHSLIIVLNRKDDVAHSYRLFKYLKQKHMDYPDLADICFIVGKLFTEKLNRREDASKIIRWGINLASGELKESMQSYLKLLNS
ncbi:MAG: ABC transporter permease [Gammaproteobacteria bacterium]|nr:ABC transporter permease [Gammaproteobacteria bacterium]